MSFPREQHTITKGSVEKCLTMKSGDLFYLPKGKYHEAIDSFEQSFHLTYGMEWPRALHFIKTIVQLLYMDAAFRQETQHYDDTVAYDKIINEISDKLHAKMISDEAKMQIHHEHSQLSLLSITRFDLPNKIIGQNFSVRTIATHIKRRAKIGN